MTERTLLRKTASTLEGLSQSLGNYQITVPNPDIRDEISYLLNLNM